MIEDIKELSESEVKTLKQCGYTLKGQLADGRVFMSKPDGCGQLYSWNQVQRLIKQSRSAQ